MNFFKPNKSIVVSDFSNFSSNGGVEKNGNVITDLIEEKYGSKIIRIFTIKQKICLFLLHLLRFQKVKVVLSFKGSALSNLFFRLSGARIISRINNSPESYIYWRKFTSFISFFLRLRSINKDVMIFNSKRTMLFYNQISSKDKHFIYLPNKYFNPKEFNENKQKKIFISSRISWEKNFYGTFQSLKDIDLKNPRMIEGYTSSIDKSSDIKKFNELKIGYNDVYVSMSYFEGMPNMALEALSNGAALVLSNCWAHAEIQNDLIREGLGNRILVINEIDIEFEDQFNKFLSNLKLHNQKHIEDLTKNYFEKLDLIFTQNLGKLVCFLE